MFSHDKSGFKNLLLNFYHQLDDAEEIVKSANFDLQDKRIKNILYLGMGASAIAGDLLNDVLFSELKVPLSVIRGYSVPAYCNENTLIIASSYSGNTEETISAVNSAQDSGAQLIVLTSGGKLGELAEEQKLPYLKIPKGYPPRQALGYKFFSLYHIMGRAGLFSAYQQDTSELKHFIKNEISKHDSTKHDGHILAQELAKTIHHKIPVIYSSAPHLNTVSKRWQNQLHENSKSLAFSNVLPEMNHNEIVGWEMETELRSSMVAIFLENENVHRRIKERIELSKSIIKEHGAEVVDIYSSGGSNLEKVFSLIILGDWVSYYLAMLNRKDPHIIKNIDFLKEELAKTA
ncbi:MAG: bifunctional phosphoglucose/phosphomannose isomerase [Calditrichaeota bacterium]|nr:bifunctional phosphoglucose/phosphomannose isomerase [Calditrichota bacterium]